MRKSINYLIVALALGIHSSLGQQQQNQHLRLSRSPIEWTRDFRCQLASEQNESELIQSAASKRAHLAQFVPWCKRFWFSLMHECNRDQFAWRFAYVDELNHATVIINERSPDERLANIVDLVNSNGLVDLGYFKFNSGDSDQDRANEIRVAGQQVSEQQCARDLADMVQQLDELAAQLELIRASFAATNGSVGTLGGRHIRLVRVLDAFGRYQTGAMSGHTRLPGDYNQCVEALLERHSSAGQQHAPAELMEMRYCWAKMDLSQHISEVLQRRSRHKYETGEESLDVGVCLPRSCHSRSINHNEQQRTMVQRLIDSQFVMPHSLYANQRLKLDSVFCLADQDGQFGMPIAGKLCLVFLLLWLLLCVASTYFRAGESELHEKKQVKALHLSLDPRQRSMDVHKRPRDPSAGCLAKLAKSLNLRLSWHDFTSDRREVGPNKSVDLDVLNPVKTFACTFCVAAHAVLMLAGVADRPLQIAKSVERDLFLQTVLIASVVVDTFFVITGLLLTFITSKKLANGFGFKARPATSMVSGCDSSRASSASSLCTKAESLLARVAYFMANWLALAANRYLRLVPLYALMVWFRRDVLTYLGSGPMWDFGFNRETTNGACVQESWIMPFTFMSAFTPLSRQCFVPSWYISNDIFFGLFVPPLLLALQWRPRVALWATSVITGACTLGSLYAYSSSPDHDRWELGASRLHGIVKLFNGLSEVYTWPIYRVPSFLIGVMAGYALFRYSQERDVKRARWPNWLTGAATRASAGYVIGHTIMSGLQIYLKDLIYPYHRLFVAYLMTLDRVLWAASNAILFLRMVSDWKLRPLMRSFAGRRWKTIARLNYATMFVHWIFIIIQTGVMTTLPTFTYWQLYTSAASILLISLPVSVLVHVIIENPLDKLIKKQIFGL